MKSKKEIIVLLLIIIGVCTYIFVRKSGEVHYTLPEITSLDQDEITRIEITKGDRTVTLKKEGDNWKVMPQGYPADKNKIKPLLKTIAELTLTDLASEKGNPYPFNLDKEHRIHVKAFAGSTLLREIFIGKSAPTYRHTFVMIPGDERIYYAKENFRSKFDRDSNEFTDKLVLAVNQQDVQKIDIIKGKEEKHLVLSAPEVEINAQKAAEAAAAGKDQEKNGAKEEQKEEVSATTPVWHDASGETIEESEVQSLLADLKNLRCVGYIQGKEKKDFKDPIYKLTIEGAASHTLMIFPKEDDKADRYPAICSDVDFPFYLSKYKAETIMKHLCVRED